MKTWHWLSIVVVALAAFAAGVLIGPQYALGDAFGNCGLGAGFGVPPFRWLSMLPIWVIGLGLLGLAAFGVVSLIRSITRPDTSAVADASPHSDGPSR